MRKKERDLSVLSREDTGMNFMKTYIMLILRGSIFGPESYCYMTSVLCKHMV